MPLSDDFWTEPKTPTRVQTTHPIGTKVSTAQTEHESYWPPDVRPTRQWNVMGTIVGHVDGEYATTYEVEHTRDGTIGHYEHKELLVWHDGGQTHRLLPRIDGGR